MSKLIVIRGNSGSGKSTLASLMLSKIENATLIEQDYYIKYTPATKTTEQELKRKARIFDDIKSALVRYDTVIVEGVFDSRRYTDSFSDLIDFHPTDNHFYYLDIPFAETLRRHQGREKRDKFGENEMTQWYAQHDQFGYSFEMVFDERDTIEEVIERMSISSGVKADELKTA